ncbi:preprotein translocase subunit SecG [Lentisphaerota bacterium WC36G]|nr:preprotein translocase subunit SecG [Lentisphaerae bacterium WC36]
MSVLGIVLFSAVILIALMIIGLVLVQPSKSGGFGGSFGGIGEAVFGAHAVSHLSKLTVIFISLFFILIFALSLLNSKKNDGSKLAESQSNIETTSTVDSGVVIDKNKETKKVVTKSTTEQVDSKLEQK